ncbi:MAG: hypothetical protein ACYC56_03995 [Candidatus Aquicultor sp.]
MGTNERRGGLTAGIILIVIGIALLLINLDLFSPGVFVFALGVSFLVAYAFWRVVGFLIPGMILAWLGIAITLTEAHVFRSVDNGAVITIALGFAFLSIYALMPRRRYWWPLIPSGILLLIGTTTLLVTESIIPLTITQLTNIIWPAILILVGVWLIFRQVYRR